MSFTGEQRSTFLISRRRPALKEFLAEQSEDIDYTERRVRGELTDWRLVPNKTFAHSSGVTQE